MKSARRTVYLRLTGARHYSGWLWRVDTSNICMGKMESQHETLFKSGACPPAGPPGRELACPASAGAGGDSDSEFES